MITTRKIQNDYASKAKYSPFFKQTISRMIEESKTSQARYELIQKYVNPEYIANPGEKFNDVLNLYYRDRVKEIGKIPRNELKLGKKFVNTLAMNTVNSSKH